MNFSNIHILLVEDDEQQAIIVKTLFSSKGYKNLTTIHNGLDALAYLESNKSKPDIMLLDYLLPGLNGIELMQQLKKKAIAIPTIILTVSQNIDVAVEAMKTGAVDFLPKRANLLEQLPEMVNRIAARQAELKEKDKIKQLLKASEEKFYKSFHSNPLPMFVYNLDKDCFIDANYSFLGTTDYLTEEVLGKSIGQVPVIQRKNIARIMKLVHLEGSAKDIETLFFPRNRAAKVGILSAEQIWIGDDECLLGVVNDITERKAFETQIQLKSAEQQLLLDNIDVHIWYLKAPDIYGLVNQAHADFFEQPKQKISGSNIYHIMKKNEAAQLTAISKDVWLNKNPISYRQWITNAKGNKRLLNITLTPNKDIHSNAVRVVICIGRDITREEEADVALKKSELELRKTNETKNRMFSIIARELHSPISNLHAILKLPLDNPNTPTPNQITDPFNELTETTEHTHNLLGNLMFWAKLQTKQINILPQNLDLHQLITETKGLFKTSTDNKQIKISTQIPQGATAWGDKDLTSKILCNVISNAIKFTPNKGLVVIKASKAENIYAIEVSDSGMGISPSDLHRIFDLSEDLCTHGINNEKGAGLGLKLSKELASLNNCTLNVTSSVGNGSTFVFCLPVAPATS